jgi:hypothetical protein
MISVDGIVSGSGSSWMSMIVVDFFMARVRGATDVRGCGFRGLFNKTPVLGLFPFSLVVIIAPNIWLICAPDITTLDRNCGGVVFSSAPAVVFILPP